MLAPCATTCPPFGLTIYTAPLKGALFVSCCGTASAFAIGSAVAKEINGERPAKRLQNAYCRIFLVLRDIGGRVEKEVPEIYKKQKQVEDT